MASEWHTVGVLCGVTAEMLRVIQEDVSDTTRRCSRMFESWLEKAPGTGNKPRTWSTLLDAVQSGYGAATRECIETELRSLRSEGERLAGTTQDKVGMHWSKRWCRHVWDIGQVWYQNKLTFSSIVEWLSQSMAVTACSVLRGTCSVEQIMRQPLPMGQSCGVCSAVTCTLVNFCSFVSKSACVTVHGNILAEPFYLCVSCDLCLRTSVCCSPSEPSWAATTTSRASRTTLYWPPPPCST